MQDISEIFMISTTYILKMNIVEVQPEPIYTYTSMCVFIER